MTPATAHSPESTASEPWIVERETQRAARVSLERARAVLSALRAPKLFEGLLRVAQGRADEVPQGVLAGLLGTGVVTATSEASEPDTHRINTSAFASAAEAVQRALSEAALLDIPRIERVPPEGSAQDELVRRVALRAFAPDPNERLTERQLGDRLAVLVADVAFFRRHAVDTGVLNRTPDGGIYWLAASTNV